MIKYYSKIDWFLGLPLIAPLVLSIFEILKGNYWGIVGIIGIVALIIFISKTTNYTISNNLLVVNSLYLIHAKIEIDKINKIEKSKSWLSAPALSFDRIKLRYNKYDEIYISPKNKAQFLEELLKQNPNIIIEI